MGVTAVGRISASTEEPAYVRGSIVSVRSSRASPSFPLALACLKPAMKWPQKRGSGRSS